MADVEGKVGEFGYQEFDSKDFEDESPKSEESTEEKPDPKGEAAQGAAVSKKPEANEESDDVEEDESDDGDGEEGEGGEASDSEGTKNDAAAAAETYTPNLKYRVLDQEKEFPDWAKPLVKDKATEDHVRDLITKAEGLDTLKPRYQQATQERDQERFRANDLQGNVNRLLKLRDTNHRLFFAELGVSDEMLVRAGREIVEAKDPENPHRWSEFERARQAEYAGYQAQLNAHQSQQVSQNVQLQAHERSMDLALSRADVAAFQTQFDALHGQGAFRNAVNAHGSQVFMTDRRYVDPMTAVEHVYQFHKRGMAPAAQPAPVQTTQQPPARSGGQQARPNTLPNVGRGRNASPVQKRPRTIKEMRAANKQEIERLRREG